MVRTESTDDSKSAVWTELAHNKVNSGDVTKQLRIMTNWWLRTINGTFREREFDCEVVYLRTFNDVIGNINSNSCEYDHEIVCSVFKYSSMIYHC